MRTHALLVIVSLMVVGLPAFAQTPAPAPSSAPAAGYEWWWIILVVVIAAAVIWYFMRRRGTRV
jgi:biotin transporter BioY